MRKRLLIASLAFVIASGAHGNQASEWSPDLRLTADPGTSQLSVNFARTVAADAFGGVHVVWYDDRDGSSQVYYKRSRDDGTTWGPDVRLSDAPGRREHPAVAVSGSDVYAVWHDLRNGNPNIYGKRSQDRGLTWGPDIQISSDPSGSAHASVAVSGSNVHVIWGDQRDGQAEIYTRASYNSGATWGEEIRLSDLPFDSWVPAIAVSGNNVWAAWVDTRDGNEEEYFRRSTDGGATWGPVMRLTYDAANSWAPSIAASGHTLHLVWFDQKDSPVQPLEAETKLDEAMNLLGLQADLAPAGVMVVHPAAAAKRRTEEKLKLIQLSAPDWASRGGNLASLQAILLELQELGERGTSYFEKERKLDEALRLMGLSYSFGEEQDLPKIYYLQALGMRVEDKLHQIMKAAPEWAQHGGDPRLLERILSDFQQAMRLATTEWEIYHMSSRDGGATWGPEARLTNAAGPSFRPSIAALGNQLHVVWSDARDGHTELYYKDSPDGGITWQHDTRLTGTQNEALHPSAARSDRFLHLVWFDRRDGNAEIYYKRRAVSP